MPRLFDLLAAGALLVILSPLLAAAALANRMAGAAILFRQVRIGRRLVPFEILKFQTMTPAPPDVTTVAGAEGARVTPLGRFLRAAKIDEMPQLINVLRGEMALIGPRALTPNEVAAIPGEVAARVFGVRPGMTGLSSLVFSDEERLVAAASEPQAYYFTTILPQKMALEALYVRRRSVWLDLLLLALTPLAILSPVASRSLALRLAGEALGRDGAARGTPLPSPQPGQEGTDG